MEQFLKKVFIIFIMTMNLLAFITGIVFTLKGINGSWLICVPIMSILLIIVSNFYWW